jgi:hypothetical protein
VPFTNQFKDKYVAPHISGFTAAAIPDMSAVSPQQGHWMGNFILSSSFRVVLDDDTRRTFFGFIRRAEAAFREYGEARRLTLAHLENPNPDAVLGYIMAIGHWEQFLYQADRAVAVLTRQQPKGLFQKNDGSVNQRLNLLYNRSKHLEKAINSGQLPPDGTLAVWLTNDGLEAVDGKLTFTEIAEILTELAETAELLQDPLTMREKYLAKNGLSEEKTDSPEAIESNT